MRDKVDVAVIGGGPVGIAGALLLARYGLRVAVFEREKVIYPHPRAVHLDGDAVRLLRVLGIWNALAPGTEHVAGMTFRGARGQTLFTLPTASGSDPAAEHGTVFWQPALERLLREALMAEPTARLHLSTSVDRIQPIPGGARVVAHGPSGPVQVDARFVLACDGANSPTRERLGIGLDTLGPSARWLVVDTLVRHPERLPALACQFCDPARPSTYIPVAGRHRRWEFRWPEPHAPTPAEVAALLAPHVSPDEATVLRASVYQFQSVVAQRWRRGPVLLAGDAAHQMPPFLGQGLASGLRDVRSLAWRLALLHRGGKKSVDAEPLLASWEAERDRHVRTIVRRTAAIGRLIQMERPTFVAARDGLFGLVGRVPGLMERTAQRAATHPPLCSGLIDKGALLAGRLAPAGRIVSARGDELLDNVLRRGFAVLSREPLAERDAAPWQAAGVAVLATEDPALQSWTEGRAVVLRPDGYAYGAFAQSSLPPALQVLRRALGVPLSLGL